ncbi:MAG: thermonuclease family protein [Planctomycetes bacterium]|nr:thermonuclease family protein [Planctomycetota bacterium]
MTPIRSASPSRRARLELPPRRALLAAGIALALALAPAPAGCNGRRDAVGPAPVRPGASTGTVAKVDDGDTVTLEDGRQVRYLGVDTPERGEPLYFAAREENRRLVEGRRVTLERGGRDATDRYGRVLAVVRVAEGGGSGACAQIELLRSGLASVYVAGPDAVDRGFLEELLGAQGEAISRRAGVWRLRLDPGRAPAEPLVATRFRIHRQSCRELARARPRPVGSLEEELRQGRSLCRSCKPLDKP